MRIVCGAVANGAIASSAPSHASTRVALGESCTPAPNSSSAAARSNTTACNPALAEPERGGEAGDPGAGDQRPAHGFSAVSRHSQTAGEEWPPSVASNRKRVEQ